MSQLVTIALAQHMGVKKMKRAMRGYCIAVLWEAFEEELQMGEQAAFAAICEIFNVDHEQGMDDLVLASQAGLLGGDEEDEQPLTDNDNVKGMEGKK